MNKTLDDKQLKIKFGLKVKQLRNKLGLTQDELAEKVNRTQRQISLIEVGKSFPNTETLTGIAKVFNCRIKDLFDFEIAENAAILKTELFEIIEKMPDEKIKLLYTIGKNI